MGCNILARCFRWAEQVRLELACQTMRTALPAPFAKCRTDSTGANWVWDGYKWVASTGAAIAAGAMLWSIWELAGHAHGQHRPPGWKPPAQGILKPTHGHTGGVNYTPPSVTDRKQLKHWNYDEDAAFFNSAFWNSDKKLDAVHYIYHDVDPINKSIMEHYFGMGGHNQKDVPGIARALSMKEVDVKDRLKTIATKVTDITKYL